MRSLMTVVTIFTAQQMPPVMRTADVKTISPCGGKAWNRQAVVLHAPVAPEQGWAQRRVPPQLVAEPVRARG